jgi:hypothetical protein
MALQFGACGACSAFILIRRCLLNCFEMLALVSRHRIACLLDNSFAFAFAFAFLILRLLVRSRPW